MDCQQQTAPDGMCNLGLWSIYFFPPLILVFLLEPSGNTISKYALEVPVWNFAWSYANKVRDS